MGLVNGRGRFSTLHSSKTPGPIFMKLEHITTTQTRPCTQNFRGLNRRWWSGQIASLTHESFYHFFPFFVTPTGRIFVHIPTHNTSFPPRKRLLGVRKMKVDPLYPKNVKIGTAGGQWKIFSRRNSETVSHIQFKLGTWYWPIILISGMLIQASSMVFDGEVKVFLFCGKTWTNI